MSWTRSVFVAAVVASMSSAAWADAVVSAVTGGVLISRGQGFSRTKGPISLKVGDRATVTQGNRGKIVYNDGCTIDLLPGAVEIIGPVSPCARAAATPSTPLDTNLGGIVAGAGALGLIGYASAELATGNRTTTSGPLPPFSP